MILWEKSGILMIATGIIHNAIGLLFGWEVLVNIVEAGIFNSVNTEMDRNAIFWFLFSGFMMMLFGQLMHEYIREYKRPIPAKVGYYLLLLTVVGCIMMPVSGFWIVLPQAFIIILANAKRVGMQVK